MPKQENRHLWQFFGKYPFILEHWNTFKKPSFYPENVVKLTSNQDDQFCLVTIEQQAAFLLTCSIWMSPLKQDKTEISAELITPFLIRKDFSSEIRKTVRKIAMEVQKELVKINFENI